MLENLVYKVLMPFLRDYVDYGGDEAFIHFKAGEVRIGARDFFANKLQ